MSLTTSCPASRELRRLFVPVLKDQRQRVRIAIQGRTVHRQRRQRQHVARSPRQLSDHTVIVVVGVAATARRQLARILRHKEALSEATHAQSIMLGG